MEFIIKSKISQKSDMLEGTRIIQVIIQLIMRFTITIETSSPKTSSGSIAFDTKLVSDTWVARVASSTRLSFIWPKKSDRYIQIYLLTNTRTHLPCGFEISYLSRKSRSELYGTHRSIYNKKKKKNGDLPQALVVSRLFERHMNRLWIETSSEYSGNQFRWWEITPYRYFYLVHTRCNHKHMSRLLPVIGCLII